MTKPIGMPAGRQDAAGPAAETPAPRPLIDGSECKGCGRCLDACPQKVLVFSRRFNARGLHYAEYTGSGCTGCCACFYNCPEPYAIRVELPPERSRPASSPGKET